MTLKDEACIVRSSYCQGGFDWGLVASALGFETHITLPRFTKA